MALAFAWNITVVPEGDTVPDTVPEGYTSPLAVSQVGRPEIE
jgi:hypothetical protein